MTAKTTLRYRVRVVWFADGKPHSSISDQAVVSLPVALDLARHEVRRITTNHPHATITAIHVEQLTPGASHRESQRVAYRQFIENNASRHA